MFGSRRQPVATNSRIPVRLERRIGLAASLRLLSVLTMLLFGCIGCGTTSTSRVTEQLLVSSAVDEAISKISFDDLRGETVYLDSSYVQPVKELGFANTNYIISGLRQQLLASGCLLQESRDQADIIVEPRVGALGTEGQMVTFGIPQSREVSAAASIFTSAPIIPTIPEIAFGKSDLQRGAAKIAIFAYFRESRIPVWQSGTRVAHSSSKKTWVLGAGPVRQGTIHNGLYFAGLRLGLPGSGPKEEDIYSQPNIPYENEFHYEPFRLAEESSSDAIQLTGGEEPVEGEEAGSGSDGDDADK